MATASPAWLEFNRQHSRETGRKLEEVSRSTRLLVELQKALDLASEVRVNATRNHVAGQAVTVPQTEERAASVARVLAQAGAVPTLPRRYASRPASWPRRWRPRPQIAGRSRQV